MQGIGADHQNGKAVPGWGDFVAERGALPAAQARTHYSLFGIMKSHMLLSLDLTRVGNETLAILLKRCELLIKYLTFLFSVLIECFNE